MEQYEQYFIKVIQGELGPTAQCWCGYVYIINWVHRDLMRAVRTNNIDSYIAILPAVIDVFFWDKSPKFCLLRSAFPGKV